MINCLKNLTILRILVLVVYFKKTGYNTKLIKLTKKLIIMIMVKYITTQEFNKLTADNFTARLKPANSSSKNDVTNFVKKILFLVKN